jgi:hypothetical protein
MLATTSGATVSSLRLIRSPKQRTLNERPGWKTSLANSGKTTCVDRWRGSTPAAFEQMYYEKPRNHAEGATLKLSRTPLGDQIFRNKKRGSWAESESSLPRRANPSQEKDSACICAKADLRKAEIDKSRNCRQKVSEGEQLSKSPTFYRPELPSAKARLQIPRPAFWASRSASRNRAFM